MDMEKIKQVQDLENSNEEQKDQGSLNQTQSSQEKSFEALKYLENQKKKVKEEIKMNLQKYDPNYKSQKTFHFDNSEIDQSEFAFDESINQNLALSQQNIDNNSIQENLLEKNSINQNKSENLQNKIQSIDDQELIVNQIHDSDKDIKFQNDLLTNDQSEASLNQVAGFKQEIELNQKNYHDGQSEASYAKLGGERQNKVYIDSFSSQATQMNFKQNVTYDKSESTQIIRVNDDTLSQFTTIKNDNQNVIFDDYISQKNIDEKQINDETILEIQSQNSFKTRMVLLKNLDQDQQNKQDLDKNQVNENIPHDQINQNQSQHSNTNSKNEQQDFDILQQQFAQNRVSQRREQLEGYNNIDYDKQFGTMDLKKERNQFNEFKKYGTLSQSQFDIGLSDIQKQSIIEPSTQNIFVIPDKIEDSNEQQYNDLQMQNYDDVQVQSDSFSESEDSFQQVQKLQNEELQKYIQDQAQLTLEQQIQNLVRQTIDKELSKQTVQEEIKKSILSQSVVSQNLNSQFDKNNYKNYNEVKVQEIDMFSDRPLNNSHYIGQEISRNILQQNGIAQKSLKQSLTESYLQNENLQKYCILCRKYIEDSEDIIKVGIEHINGIHPILFVSKEMMQQKEFQNLFQSSFGQIMNIDNAQPNQSKLNDQEQQIQSNEDSKKQKNSFGVQVLSESFGSQFDNKKMTSAFLLGKNQKFQKTWTIINTGQQIWPGNGSVRIVCLEKDSPFYGELKKIMKPVRPGEKIRITLNLIARQMNQQKNIVQSLFRLIILNDYSKLFNQNKQIQKSDLLFKSSKNNSLSLKYQINQEYLNNDFKSELQQKKDIQFLFQDSKRNNLLKVFHYFQIQTIQKKLYGNKYQRNIDQQIKNLIVPKEENKNTNFELFKNHLRDYVQESIILQKNNSNQNVKHVQFNIDCNSSVYSKDYDELSSQQEFKIDNFQKEEVKIDFDKQFKIDDSQLIDSNYQVCAKEYYLLMLLRLENGEDIEFENKVYKMHGEQQRYLQFQMLKDDMRQLSEFTNCFNFDLNMNALLQSKNLNQAVNFVLEQSKKNQAIINQDKQE